MGKGTETEANDGKGGEEQQEESTNAKGNEGHKSLINNRQSAPGLTSNAVEEEVAGDAMNWMEIAAASAIAIVVSALAVALVMRTKQKSAANQTETEMATVT